MCSCCPGAAQGNLGWRPESRGQDGRRSLPAYRETKDFEAAGAYAVEMEVVPHQVTAAITKNTSLLTISLGSGGICDIQYLFSADLLGENRGHIPRHAKSYRNLAAELDKIQAEHIAAYKEHVADIKTGDFPAAGNVVELPEVELDGLISRIESLRS